MPNLKFLHVKDIDFDGDFERSLVELRWLKCERCRDSFGATNFHLEKLVVLDLSDNYKGGSCISENWRGWSLIKMESLKVLNLSWCLGLQSTPNLSAFKNLELLILENCANLKEIDSSIGDVKCLLFLNLRCCGSFEKLPEQVGELENLEQLIVDHTSIKKIPPRIGSLKKLKRLSAMGPPKYLQLEKCGKLQWIPSSIGKLGELVELDLSHTAIKELPESIGKLNKLKILNIFNSQIERLPSSIGKLQNLQELDANRCPNLEGQIHVDKGGLSSLKTLCLGHTKISHLSKNLDQLSSLEHLNLYHYYKLESLPKPPCSLLSLKLTCRSNELPSLSHLKHLQELTLDGCESLRSIPLLSHMKHLQELWLWECGSLQSIPELPSCMRKLHISGSPELERLPNLSDLEFLSELWLVRCDGLKKLDGLEALKSLRKLCLPIDSDQKVDHLHAIEGLEKLGSLEVLSIWGRKHIQVLDLSKSEHLMLLNVDSCESLVEIHCPSKFLTMFLRSGCKSLEKLPDLVSNSKNLTEVFWLSSDLTLDSIGYNLMRVLPKIFSW